jgi:glucose-6-phosphate dehydrogenase assembly protein OpcA
MIRSEGNATLGIPVPVDAASIERALTALWKTASGREGEAAVIRACSCNLVVVARDRNEAQDVLPVVARIAEWHPSRTVIAYREPAAPEENPMEGWISAQCSFAGQGAPQICSEAIVIAARGKAADELPPTLLSLLAPDLDVFLYWRSFSAQELPWFEKISRFANLLIVDSHGSKDNPEERRRLLEFLTALPEGTAVRDLNWSRLTAWRDLVAQFFDAPVFRDEPYHISEVEIFRSVAAPGNIPTRTLLLTGWLASSLQWRRIAAERNSDQWLSRWESRSGEVTVRFSGSPARHEEEPGISSVVIRTRTGNEFSVVRGAGSSCITATSSGKGPHIVHSVPQEDTSEARLLAHELSLSGDDAVFRSALPEAAALERSFD